ncbi:hypothetical protein NWE60_01045 [Mycoplasmopsis felis]|nr:hypothetical protein [Mycoplasmopsis felis]WAM01243.1 hypothetical protein NWE60_01045 [Mycoplasmopsis felis]
MKEFESDLTKANSQNSNNNFDIEQGLKATRTLLKDLYAYLQQYLHLQITNMQIKLKI